MSGPVAGWYDDGVTPGVERWFDGSAWTEHTRSVAPAFAAVDQPPTYPAPGFAAVPPPGQDYSGQGYGGEGYAGQGYGGQGYPGPSDAASGYATPSYAAQGYAAPSYPSQGSAVPSYPPHGYPAQGYPAQGYPAQGYPAPGYPAPGLLQPTSRGVLDAGPGEAAHWLLPVGRSWQAVVAPYAGLFAIFIWFLAPIAIWFGVWALLKARTGGHGRGRAVFALVGGAIGLMLLAVAMVNGL